MKFRAKMCDLGSIRLFYRILGAVSKVANPTCTIRITPNTFSIFTQLNPTIGSQIVAEIKPEYVFDEYNMTGYAENHNEIYIEVNPEVLMRGLKVPQNNAKAVRMKLTNRTGPCFCIEAELPSQNAGKSRLTEFNVPIVVVNIKSWNEITPKEALPYTISCNLPPYKIFKTVIDRMRNLSPNYVELSLSAQAVLRARVGGGSEEYEVMTEFPDMDMSDGPDWVPESQGEEEAYIATSGGFYSLTVDIKKLATFLAANQVPASHIRCDIKHSGYLQLTTGSQESFTVRYYLPAVDLQGFI